MTKILGIIGGGQLGMMITEAAKKMPEEISKVIVLDPTKDCPASQAGATQIIADFKDRDAIIKLAELADIITYEIESGDSSVLKSVQGAAEINPSPETLEIIQDKYKQKSFLQNHDIPVSEFVEIQGMSDIITGLETFGYPALLKARRDAYDGRGNFKIESKDDIQKAWDYFDDKSLLLERFVPFSMEVSVIAARNTRGQIKTYPLVENIHKENILRETIAPARVSQSISKKAEQIAVKTLSVLKGAGTFGIEMFVTHDEILINEIAPRVHNSGHHTLQSSETSQFEQHLRAILGLELGSTRLLYNSIMFNVLGSDEFTGRYSPLEISGAGVFLKMYGKKVSKPLRKLGHVNIVGINAESVDELLAKLDTIKPNVAVEPI